jgi:hypothetical protein
VQRGATRRNGVVTANTLHYLLLTKLRFFDAERENIYGFLTAIRWRRSLIKLLNYPHFPGN